MRAAYLMGSWDTGQLSEALKSGFLPCLREAENILFGPEVVEIYGNGFP